MHMATLICYINLSVCCTWLVCVITSPHHLCWRSSYTVDVVAICWNRVFAAPCTTPRTQLLLYNYSVRSFPFQHGPLSEKRDQYTTTRNHTLKHTGRLHWGWSRKTWLRTGGRVLKVDPTNRNAGNRYTPPLSGSGACSVIMNVDDRLDSPLPL